MRRSSQNIILMRHDHLRDRFYRGVNRVGRLQTTRNVADAETFDPTSKAALKRMVEARKDLERRGWTVVYVGIDPENPRVAKILQVRVR